MFTQTIGAHSTHRTLQLKYEGSCGGDVLRRWVILRIASRSFFVRWPNLKTESKKKVTVFTTCSPFCNVRQTCSIILQVWLHAFHLWTRLRETWHDYNAIGAVLSLRVCKFQQRSHNNGGRAAFWWWSDTIARTVLEDIWGGARRGLLRSSSLSEESSVVQLALRGT
jgi:hypothetical protein